MGKRRVMNADKKEKYISLLFNGVPVRKAASIIGTTSGTVTFEENRDPDFREGVRNALKLSHEDILSVERLLLEGGTLGFIDITEHFKGKRDNENNYLKDKDGNTVLELIGKDIRRLPPDIRAMEIILKAYKPDVYCDHLTITNNTENPKEIKTRLESRLAELN